MRLFLPLALITMAIAACKPAAPDAGCHERTFELPCSSAPCVPLKVTELAGACLERSGPALGLVFGMAGTDGTTFLFTGPSASVVVLERDGREHAEHVLSANWFGLMDGSVPLVFGEYDPPPDSTGLGHPPSYMLARRQDDGWTTEPIAFPGVESFYDGNFGSNLHSAVVSNDGTLYASFATNLSPNAAVVTKPRLGPWTVMSEPTLPPSAIPPSRASLFVHSTGKLGLLYSKCPQNPGPAAPCERMTRVYGDPSSERSLGFDYPYGVVSSTGYSEFVANLERWYFFGRVSASSTFRLRTVDDQGTSEVAFPEKSYPGVVGNCDTPGDAYECAGRCHVVGSDITGEAAFAVTSDGVPWVLYVDVDEDLVTQGGGATSIGTSCPLQRLSGYARRSLVVSRLDGGHEIVRGRWAMPDGWDEALTLSVVPRGTELQVEAELSPIGAGRGLGGKYRLSIDTAGMN